MTERTDSDLLDMTTEVVSAYVSNNRVQASEIADLIRSVHEALSGTSGSSAEPEPPKATKSEIRKSITSDALISFEDGKPYKTLRRHLAAKGLTFPEYLSKWGLPADYPAVAPAYAAQRSEIAKSLGLGQRNRRGAQTRSRRAKSAKAGG